MPTYRLDIDVNGHDNGATSVLLDLKGGLGALNVAMGSLVADGIKALAGGLWSLGKQGLSVATDYQSSLNMFQAVSGATGEQMASVAAEAKTLGGDMTLPATSAGDAARAMTELAKAGLSVDAALKAGKGTLQLAAAGAMDEAQAAEIAANALNAFGLSGDKATLVADMFAATANKSSVEVRDVADSFKMASAVFSAFQGPVVGSQQAMTDLTAAIGLLGNVGIKGSDAGTSLKQMLLQLTGPSSVAKDEMKGLMFAAMDASGGMEQLDDVLQGNASERAKALGELSKANPALADMGDIAYDASGKMRSLPEIIGLVSRATKNMSDEQRNAALTSIFGADATRAVIALMRAGPDAFNSMESAITQQGAAADLANAQMKGLGGAWEGFKSTLETALLTASEPLLGPLETGVRAAAAALSDATPALLNFVTTALIPTVTNIATFVSALATAPDKIGFLTGQIGALGGMLTGELQTALPGWLAGLEQWGVSLIGWIQPQILPLLAQGALLIAQLSTWALDQAPGIAASMLLWGAALVGWIAPQIPHLLGGFLDLRNQAIGFVLANAPMLIGALQGWSLALLGWIIDAAPGMIREFTAGTAVLIGLIGQYAPGIIASLAQWGLALAQWVVAAAPGLLREFGGAVGQLLDAVGVALPGIVEALAHWGAELIGWVITAAPGLFRELLTLNGSMLSWIGERIPGIAEKLGEWTLAFIGWIGPASAKTLLNLGTMLGDLLKWIVDSAPSLLEKLGTWTSTFVTWAIEHLGPALLTALGQAFGGLWGGLNKLADGASGTPSAPGVTVPGFASGVENYRGGLAVVGEDGPELLDLPGGSSVTPAGPTASFLDGLSLPMGGGGGGGGGGSFTWNGDLVVQGSDDPRATALAVRDELIRIGRANGDIFGGF